MNYIQQNVVQKPFKPVGNKSILSPTSKKRGWFDGKKYSHE
jgi:hypothetical protein